MAICVNFGKYNKNYKYVILEFVFMILKYYLPTILTDIFLYKELINDNTLYLFNHDHIIDIFRFFGLLIFSMIFYIYEKKVSKSELIIGQSNDSNLEKGCFEVVKYNDERKKKINNKKNLLNIIIIIAFCLIIEFLAEIVSPISIFSFWMIILLTISYIKSKMFKLTIYKHHKLAIYFTFIVAFIFQLTSFIISKTSEEENDEYIYKEEYLSLWFLPLGLIIYFVYVCIISYVYSKMKWFMDLKLISLTKLFMIYTLVGFFISIIYSLILTYIKCEGKVSDYFCIIVDNKGEKYLENISVFFDEISYIYGENKKYIIYFICIIFVDLIFNSLFIFYFFYILKNLSPEFFFFIGSLSEIFIYIIQIFENKIFYKYYFVEEGNYKMPLIKFLLYIIGNFLAFIGCLVYSEIIELNFYDFNYNLRRKIIERSIEDSIQRTSINDDLNESLIDDESPNKISELSTKTLN